MSNEANLFLGWFGITLFLTFTAAITNRFLCASGRPQWGAATLLVPIIWMVGGLYLGLLWSVGQWLFYGV